MLLSDIYDNEYDEVYYAIFGFKILEKFKNEEIWQKELIKTTQSKLYEIFYQHLQKKIYNFEEILIVANLFSKIKNESYEFSEIFEEFEFQINGLIKNETINPDFVSKEDDILFIIKEMNIENVKKIDSIYCIHDFLKFGDSLRKLNLSFHGEILFFYLEKCILQKIEKYN